MLDRLEKGAAIILDDAQVAEYLVFANSLADASGKVITPQFRVPLDIDNKATLSGFDPVTIADRDAEAVIREMISRVYPTHGVYGEEHGYDPGSSGLTWVIDPIDGTKAFISGMPLWGTLIALFDGERPVLGVVDQPYLGERFIGSRLGAELHSRDGVKALRSRACPEVSQAILYTTHPDLLATDRDREAYAALAKRARLSRYGGDCYNYCMLACGFVDLVIESGLKPYDVQALIPIVEAAGGLMTNWSGGPAGQGGQVIAAGDRQLHAQALDLLSKAA